MFLQILRKKEFCKYIYFDETSCCSIELINFFTSKFDPERLGYKRTYNIENSDVIILCGYTSESYLTNINNYINTKKTRPNIVAMGGCAISGGPLASHISKADIYIPGCPPRPESIVDALIKLKKIRGKNAL